MRNSAVFIRERQKRAIQEFCGPGANHADILKAAESAGSNELEVRQVFAELCKKPFKDSLDVFDVNKPFLAAKCQELLKNPKTKPAEKITLLKLLLKTMGEATEEAQTNVNINSPKALVMVGTTKKRIDAMLSPQEIPQLPEVADV